MILPQPPVATFVQDDSTRPPVVSAQMGYRARKKAPSAGTNGVTLRPILGLGTNPLKIPTNTASLPHRTSAASKTNRKGRSRSNAPLNFDADSSNPGMQLT
jgi:hypothetical protein